MARGTTVLALVTILVAGATGQNNVLVWQSFNSGGAPCTAQSFRLNGSVAQPVQGRGWASSLRGFWGFWYGLEQVGGVAETPGSPGASLAIVPSVLTEGRAILRYSLPEAGPLGVAVFDAAGRLVFATRSLGRLTTGSLPLDLRKLSAGVYLVRLDAEGFTATEKLVVQR